MKKLILNSMLIFMGSGALKAQFSESYIHKNNGKNTSLNYSVLDQSKINSNQSIALLVTHNSNPVGSKSMIHDHKVGLFYSSEKWRVFNEDFTKMDTSLAFNIFIPDADVKSWVHIADSALNTENFTELNHPLINGDSSAIIFISDVWNYNNKPGVYNTNTMGVFYSKSAKKWHIFNEDKSKKMVRNSAYSVVIPEKFSKIPRFVHRSKADNIVSNTTLIDHTSTNNNPNAKIFVTHNWNPDAVGGKYHNHNIGVFYNGSKWVIFNEDLSAMDIGVSFNVMIYPDKINAINKYTMNNKIHIFPNPVQNGKLLEIEINNSIQGELKIEVYDLMGKLWLTKTIIKGSSSTKENLLMEGIAKGVYILKVSNREYSSNQKFVIE